MTVRHLKIFVAVCEEKSITKAGKKLFMAQPTVSFAVAELEKYYGAKLFDRISKRLYLTDAGENLLPYARHIVSMFEEMETNIRDRNSQGTLHIGASITIGNCILPGLIKSFAACRPGISIQVQVDNTGRIEQSVLGNHIDFGLIEGIPHSAQIVSETLCEDELGLLFAPGHRWEKQRTVAPDELKNELFLMREQGSGGREILESALLLHNIEIKPAWESISTQAIVRAAANGLGVTVLPLLLVEPYLTQKKLVTRPIEGISLKRKLSVIHHKDKYITDPMREFMNLCHSEMAPELLSPLKEAPPGPTL